MIKTEFYKTREDGVDLYRTYSDLNVKIQCNETGNIYDEVVNIQNSGHTFIETNYPIVINEEYNPEEAVQALHILLGT